ncbi:MULTISPECIES: hypothetical protein [unclassified Streptomyces]|uniref:hypothetical protein n=1 Tax=unclassified Streptomyces TaxID=2593676 RepID=UPI0029A92516|nr:hypothetical protein [Streptomyces sp. FL07-04A]MDX3576614.1 hypothetical protein [Streptomyces sp. FL07-04A]
MPATEPPPRPSRPLAPAPAVSMRDLLASCAAAEAVSTPPRLPDPAPAKKPARRRAA